MGQEACRQTRGRATGSAGPPRGERSELAEGVCGGDQGGDVPSEDVTGLGFRVLGF